MFGKLRERITKLEEIYDDIAYHRKISYSRIDYTCICDRCGGIFLEYCMKFNAVMDNSTAKRKAYCINCWEKISADEDNL